jgi:hypothetical protein
MYLNSYNFEKSALYSDIRNTCTNNPTENGYSFQRVLNSNCDAPTTLGSAESKN